MSLRLTLSVTQLDLLTDLASRLNQRDSAKLRGEVESPFRCVKTCKYGTHT